MTATAAAAGAVNAAVATPRPLRFVDVGINLTDHVFRGKYRGKKMHRDDLDAVLQRAKDVGMKTMVITGGSLSESREAVQLARSLGMYCTVGCHPTRCGEFLKAPSPEEYYAGLEELIAANLDIVKAIGECGLDYDRLEFCPREVQLRFFPWHFKLAAKFKLPMFLHCRNTGDDFARLMTEHAELVRECGGGLVHSFTGPVAELRMLLDLGLHISINGCSMKTEENLAAIRVMPLDRLMIETDAPWCDIRPTHASHSLRWPRGRELSLKSRATGSQSAAPNPVDPFQQRLRQYALTLLPNDYPSVKEPAKFAEGHIIRGRNEPCCITHVFEVLYTLRHAEVADPVALADMLYNNTVKFFKIDPL